ncbi:hypothetical protein [Streptomyces sp. NBC_00299]|uniref:hypothetical protein n=1 Tax=Streptomyces sp. NBC_00299 TaxID=2975705 RepID=UPI002E2B89AA|nr:hypothetical protein [Streptomyces sp. NBC_00299]
MATPADMPRKHIPKSARTRVSLEAVITALAESIEQDGESIDIDAVVTLTRLTDATAKLTDAQARYTEALNQRHAQRATQQGADR